ncbi:MAG: CG0192-related protein [Nocardioides sp.]
MALLHRATMDPTKRDLAAAWLRTRAWCHDADVEPLVAYRFDDPAGEVGVEAVLLRASDGTVFQLPLTYRGAPLEGAEEHLVGTTAHSVLGQRWVYDGCADPVWASTFATAVLTGGREAEQYFEVDGRREVREPAMTVVGSGSPGADVPDTGVPRPHDEGRTTVVEAGPLTLLVARVVGDPIDVAAGAAPGDWGTLSGAWAGTEPVVLGGVRRTTR